MRILIVKSSALGDILQVFPALSYLRSRFPQATIDWCVEKPYETLLQAHPAVNQVIPLDTRKWRKNIFKLEAIREFLKFKKFLSHEAYDLVFDFQANIKSAFITALAKGDKKIGFGPQSVAERPNLWVTNVQIDPHKGLPMQQKYLYLVQSYFKDEAVFDFGGVKLRLSREEEERKREILSLAKGHSYTLMVAFSSKWKNKELSLDALGDFLRQIPHTPFFFFIYGTEEEKRKAEALKQLVGQAAIIGNLSLPLWQAVMGDVSEVIAMDSAALHLCATTKTASFSFFGPSIASIYKPIGKQHRYIQGLCPYKVPFSTRCPKLRTCSTGACLKDLKAEEIVRTFQKDGG